MSGTNMLLILGGVFLNTSAQLFLKQGMQSGLGYAKGFAFGSRDSFQCLYLGWFVLLCAQLLCLAGGFVQG